MPAAAQQAEVERFTRDGFVVLRDVLHPAELEALQVETAAQIEAGGDRGPAVDFHHRDTGDGGRRFFRIQNIAAKSLRNNAPLLCVAQPRILRTVEAILGADWALYGTALVFKARGGGPEISPHRDTHLDRAFAPEHVAFNVDIHLDRAAPDTGCLRVIPGSNHSQHAAGGIDDAALVDVVMEPGDVLVHDVRLVHGSRATGAGAPLRRVIYNSYQSAAWMAREGVLPGHRVSRRWIAQQIRLAQHAIACRRATAWLAGEAQHEHAVPDEWRDEVAAVPLDLRPVEGTLPWEQPGFRF